MSLLSRAIFCCLKINAELLEKQKQIDELTSTFDQQSNPLLGSSLDRLRMILQANHDHQQTLSITSMNEKLFDLKENLISLLKIDEQDGRFDEILAVSTINIVFQKQIKSIESRGMFKH